MPREIPPGAVAAPDPLRRIAHYESSYCLHCGQIIICPIHDDGRGEWRHDEPGVSVEALCVPERTT
jgi:hypothetical protein